jgi:hypothetical protein
MLHQPRTRAGYFHERIDYFDWAPKWANRLGRSGERSLLEHFAIELMRYGNHAMLPRWRRNGLLLRHKSVHGRRDVL